MRGVLDGWLCWLFLEDMAWAMGTDTCWFCTTEADRGGLAAMVELFRCMAAAATMGDDMF